MKRINLKEIQEVLSEKELKNVLGGGPTSSGTHSLKCFNTETSCWVNACPGSTTDAQALCKTSACGGSYGSLISCA